MRLLHWSLSGALTVSIGVACGASDTSKALPPNSTGGEAGSATGGEPTARTDPGPGGAGVVAGAAVGGQPDGQSLVGGASGVEGPSSAGQGGVAASTDGGATGRAGAGGGEGGAGPGSCVAVSALGGHIYYSTLPVAPATEGEVRIATPSGDSKLTDGQNPKLSPDGKHLAFQLGRRSLSDLSTADLWMRDMDAATQKAIFSNPDHQVGYAFTNASDRLLFDYSCAQYSMDLDGGTGATLFSSTCYDDSPNLQPTSTATLAYHNQSGIQLRDAAFSNQVTLTSSIAGDYWPVWSPDGQSLTFCRFGSSDVCALQTIAPNGDSLTYLGDTTNANNAAFSSDGAKVVVGGLHDGNGGLHVFAADGSGYLGTVCGAATGAVEFVGTITAD